ncbi:phosphoribosylglycinamide formyltransferase [Arenimonas fontis]|uniref:Phosphoribosylglycinamide formyltransferase n=1 Tax=Arenimonas fontis TaxID=2608255 RepID=A0A5B2ZCK4_9GAMM|nr:phosphoribosylglycinamide formyltransferase [Arenimonas fontis]KAA2284862.1 phosphoribosylglycinamide formyltransferase [Arenimonas fontis]
MRDFRIAVLASGRGSNLRALLDAIAGGRVHAGVVGVFSDRPGCRALDLARAAGLPAVAVSPRGFASRAAHDEALFSEVAAVQPDLIVCAGYLRIIGEDAVRRFMPRMINIHPSLLPHHPGLDTHARVLAAGDREHGASVHVVIPALDAGPVLAQVRIAVRPGDDPASLAARLLPREHALLSACVGLIAEGRLQPDTECPRLDGVPLRRPLRLGDDNHLHGD